MSSRDQEQPPIKKDPGAAFKRSGPRRVIRVTLVRIDDGDTGVLGYAKNISRSGMLVHTLSPRQSGEKLKLEFVLPSERMATINCSARVAWSQNFSLGTSRVCRVGLQFIDLPSAVEHQIDAWVKGHAGE